MVYKYGCAMMAEVKKCLAMGSSPNELKAKEDSDA